MPSFIRGKAFLYFICLDLAGYIGHWKFDRKFMQIIAAIGKQYGRDFVDQLTALFGVEQMIKAGIDNSPKLFLKEGGSQGVCYLEIQ